MRLSHSKWWRPPALALAAVLACGGAASAQSGGIADKIQLCGACHGEDGVSRMPDIPSLAGQPKFFVLNQLFLMREGVRKIPAMAAIVKDLTDPDLEALGEHFSKLPAKASDEPVDPAMVKRGAEIASGKLCVSCHLPTLAGSEQVPRLARQRIDYLITALKSYRDGSRAGADSLMFAPVAGLPDTDLTALAHFAASH